MAYNKELEQRIASVTQSWTGLTAKKMFGGVGYMLKGNMCFGVHKDFLILRLGEEEALQALSSGDARPFDITGRAMKGWIMIHASAVTETPVLEKWLKKAQDFCLTLPPK